MRSFLALCVLALAIMAGATDKAVKLDSIAGVRVGMKLEEVRELLGAKGVGSGGDDEEHEGSVKEAWTLKSGEFKSLAYKADAKGRIVWVTGWLREGKSLPFEVVGDVSKAALADKNAAIWNVSSPGGSYRVVVKGGEGKASLVTLLSLQKG